MIKCAYHPEADAIGACVSCGRLICVECKTVLREKIYCNPCAEKLFAVTSIPPAQAKEKAAYNKTLRVISGIFGVLFIFTAMGGFLFFLESGLVTALIVEIITIIIAVLLLLMAFIPEWVSAKLKIKLEKGSIFGLVLVILVIVVFIAAGLGPQPPGGWWEWGRYRWNY